MADSLGDHFVGKLGVVHPQIKIFQIFRFWGDLFPNETLQFTKSCNILIGLNHYTNLNEDSRICEIPISRNQSGRWGLFHEFWILIVCNEKYQRGYFRIDWLLAETQIRKKSTEIKKK